MKRSRRSLRNNIRKSLVRKREGQFTLFVGSYHVLDFHVDLDFASFVSAAVVVVAAATAAADVCFRFKCVRVCECLSSESMLLWCRSCRTALHTPTHPLRGTEPNENVKKKYIILYCGGRAHSHSHTHSHSRSLSGRLALALFFTRILVMYFVFHLKLNVFSSEIAGKSNRVNYRKS